MAIQLIPENADTAIILEKLAHGPNQIQKLTDGVINTRLQRKTDEEPWSVHDILAHLRACSDYWGGGIREMLTEDDLTFRYKSPRSLMWQPQYQDMVFSEALESFAEERTKLIDLLESLDEAGWVRGAILTGTSPRQREQTVFSYASRLVNHEQVHLEQIEQLLETFK